MSGLSFLKFVLRAAAATRPTTLGLGHHADRRRRGNRRIDAAMVDGWYNPYVETVSRTRSR